MAQKDWKKGVDRAAIRTMCKEFCWKTLNPFSNYKRVELQIAIFSAILKNQNGYIRENGSCQNCKREKVVFWGFSHCIPAKENKPFNLKMVKL
jgi:hypothetical protein